MLDFPEGTLFNRARPENPVFLFIITYPPRSDRELSNVKGDPGFSLIETEGKWETREKIF